MSDTLTATEPEAATAVDPPRRRPSPRLGELNLYLAAAGLTCVFTTLALRLWNASRAIPFTYSADALGVGAHFKTILETGWYESQPALGAPFGQVYHDFPTADNLHMAVVAVMNAFVDNWAVAFNVYYLLGFPLAALTAVWFFRLVGVSRSMTVVLAVLFALAPYHVERNQGHLFLASYYPVPLAAGIVVMALRGSALWGLRAGDRPILLAFLTGTGAMTAVAMVLVGTASSYYGIFTAVLLGVAGLAALWRDRNWRRFAGIVAAGTVLAATMLVNMAPDLLYTRGRDSNPLAITRNPEGTEVYGLKLVQLLLPSYYHRWKPLRDLRLDYNDRFPLPGESPVLGAVAAAGLVILLCVMASAFVVPARRGTTLRHLALLTLTALTVAAVGGLSTFIALFVTDNVRGWNRMSIFIAAFCLGAVGLAVDGLVRWGRALRPGGHRLGVRLPALLATGVLGVGLVDQTSPRYVPKYAEVRASYTSDATYVRAIEEQLPAGAAVYQLPHQVFPESPPLNGAVDTDQLRLYLSSTDTRWSAGGLKGRPRADWPRRLETKPIATVVPLLAIAGFSGVSVDRKALGDTAPQVEAELAVTVGAGPTVASPDGRFVFWPLADLREQMTGRHDASELEALRQATLLPPTLYFAPDFDEPVRRGAGTSWHSRTPKPQLLLDNARDTPLTVQLSFAVTSPTGASGVEVQLPGREPMSLDLTDGPASVEVDLVLPPGRSFARLRLTPAARAAAADPDDASFDVLDALLTDPVLKTVDL